MKGTAIIETDFFLKRSNLTNEVPGDFPKTYLIEEQIADDVASSN